VPPLERADLIDTAVVWPALARGGYDGHRQQQQYDPYGEIRVGRMVQIDVRWVGKQTKMTDKQGNTVMLDAVMILDEDSDDIPLDSIVYHGTTADLTGTGSFASPENELYQVKYFYDTPDIKYRNRRLKAGLMRFRDKLPQLVISTDVPVDE
jgi:hypothetical protein